ncbi:class II aldolase/adducin family protein [Microbacterium sp. NPDC076911]|uniref:class II aldolase/adducin family protein n=1 Tax=Microbacterium sp. NPDC076911 TaxID=3154958 RepID=UPI00344190CF
MTHTDLLTDLSRKLGDPAMDAALLGEGNTSIREGDAEVDALFSEIAAREGRRPSVEALLHVVIYEATGAQVVAHSHPTSVNALLCSQRAELLVEGALFPDQIVVLGATPLLVPYIDPGIRLAREVRGLLRAHIEKHGGAPRVIYLRNHGMFALGANAAEVLGATAMAQKCARALIGAESVGGVKFMPAEEVGRIDSRPDEKYRRALLAGGGK